MSNLLILLNGHPCEDAVAFEENSHTRDVIPDLIRDPVSTSRLRGCKWFFYALVMPHLFRHLLRHEILKQVQDDKEEEIYFGFSYAETPGSRIKSGMTSLVGIVL